MTFPFVTEFYQTYIHEDYSLPLKAKIFKYYVSFMDSEAVLVENKANAGQQLILPMLTKAFMEGKGKQIMTSSNIKIIR